MEELHPYDQRPSSTELSPLRRSCQMQPVRQALLKKKTLTLQPLEELRWNGIPATSSAAYVIPAMTVLKWQIAQENSVDGRIKTMRGTILQAVSTRFSTFFFSSSTPLECHFTGPSTVRQVGDFFMLTCKFVAIKHVDFGAEREWWRTTTGVKWFWTCVTSITILSKRVTYFWCHISSCHGYTTLYTTCIISCGRYL